MGFIEKSAKESLEDYILGRPVTVTWMNTNGKREFMDLDEILGFDGNRFLVDMPDDITEPAPEEIVQAVHDTQEEPEDCPPNALQREEKSMEKSKREEAAELSEKGMSMREISNELGISYNTVYGWLRKPKSGKAGDNADRHLCRTCQYSMGSYRKSNAGMNCNYIGITGKKRPCKPESCTVYVKGERLPDKEDE